MGFLSKPKITAQPALPPAANPPVFASVYSRVAAENATKKKKVTPKDAGFGDDAGKTQTQALAAATPTATPSLLG